VAAAPSGGTNAGSGNNSNLLFEGTFDSTLSKYPVKYYNAHSLTVLNSRQLRFDVSSADSLSGNEGNYRADLSTANSLIPSGTPTCTTIPIQFPNGLATVPHNSWFMFAQQKPGNVDYQGWNMGVSSWYNNNQNTWTIGTQGLGSAPAWASTKPIDTGIHTFSICSNNASDNTGAIYSIWMDGVRQTFNQGASAGKTSISGFPINKSASSYPIDINLYTGGSPVPSSLIHGAVLVNKISSPDATPPMPPGGWNSF
jgi:hypothetical protein